MSNLQYRSSKIFKTHSVAVANNLKNSSVSVVRHAMAKADSFDDVRSYNLALDTQQHTDISNALILELHEPLLKESAAIAYSINTDCSFNEFPSEQFIDNEVIMIPSIQNVDELHKLPTSARMEDLQHMASTQGELSQLIWEDLLEHCVGLTVDIMNAEIETEYGELSMFSTYQTSIEEHLHSIRDLVEAKLSTAILLSLLKNDTFKTSDHQSTEKPQGDVLEAFAFDHRNALLITQTQYNKAYGAYVTRMNEKNQPVEVSKDKLLTDIKSSELSVVIHHATMVKNGLEGESPFPHSTRNNYAFIDYLERYVHEEQYKQAHKLYLVWCGNNDISPEVEASQEFGSLSKSEISRVVRHAEIEGFTLLPRE
ncbi:hypothetical protein VCHA53O466_40453 [Vibrio chagasii]|nr:hypothetical protein VCHA53O466_40453 [Vibrio chagasii]